MNFGGLYHGTNVGGFIHPMMQGGGAGVGWGGGRGGWGTSTHPFIHAG